MNKRAPSQLVCFRRSLGIHARVVRIFSFAAIRPQASFSEKIYLKLTRFSPPSRLSFCVREHGAPASKMDNKMNTPNSTPNEAAVRRFTNFRRRQSCRMATSRTSALTSLLIFKAGVQSESSLLAQIENFSSRSTIAIWNGRFGSSPGLC